MRKINEMKSNGMVKKQMEVSKSGFVLSGLEYLYNPSNHMHYKILPFLVISIQTNKQTNKYTV